MKTFRTLGSLLFFVLFFFACSSEEKSKNSGAAPNTELEFSDTVSLESSRISDDTTSYGECLCPFEIDGQSYANPELRIGYNGTDLAFCGPVDIRVSDSMMIFDALQIWDCWRETKVLEYNRPGWSLRLQKVGGRNMEIVEMIDLPRGEDWQYQSTSIFEAYLVSEDEYGIYSFTTPKLILQPEKWQDLDWTVVSQEWEAAKGNGKPITGMMLDLLFLWATTGSIDGTLAFIEARDYPYETSAQGRYEMLKQIWESLNPPGVSP